jgi:hypothetical protein
MPSHALDKRGGLAILTHLLQVQLMHLGAPPGNVWSAESFLDKW